MFSHADGSPALTLADVGVISGKHLTEDQGSSIVAQGIEKTACLEKKLIVTANVLEAEATSSSKMEVLMR